MEFMGKVGRDGNGHKHTEWLPKACFHTVLGWPHVIVQAERWHSHPWFSINTTSCWEDGWHRSSRTSNSTVLCSLVYRRRAFLGFLKKSLSGGSINGKRSTLIMSRLTYSPASGNRTWLWLQGETLEKHHWHPSHDFASQPTKGKASHDIWVVMVSMTISGPANMLSSGPHARGLKVRPQL